MRFGSWAPLALLLLGLAGPASADPAAGESGLASVELGSASRLSVLYAYPACRAGCATTAERQGLADLLSHYLGQSLMRDGLAASDVKVEERDGSYRAVFSGEAATRYPPALATLLASADKAAGAAERLRSDGRWRPDWVLFLPLGQPLTGHATVALMNFPPDYVRERRDYLAAETLRRWRGLLQINGVAAERADGFETILDVAPLAAPANAGPEIEEADPYPYFRDYVLTLLPRLAARAGDDGKSAAGKPMVVFGGAARDWVSETLGVSLRVGEVALVSIPGGPARVPVMGANHPSMIFHAAFDRDHNPNPRFGMKVMRQDLIAACWQAAMGRDPEADPFGTRDACARRWRQDRQGVCAALHTTVYRASAQAAAMACAE